ncbi:MAG: nuclear transport factor 2 family protein [Pyrinomonadaceae bacterium]
MADEQVQPKPSDHEVAVAVRQLNDEWVRAVVGRDRATLERIMAEDFNFTFILDGDDRDQFVADVVSGDLKVTSFGRDQVHVRVYGATAVLTCRDDAKWQYKGRDISGTYKTLHVYAEREGRWQLVAAQVCPTS